MVKVITLFIRFKWQISRSSKFFEEPSQSKLGVSCLNGKMECLKFSPATSAKNDDTARSDWNMHNMVLDSD